MPLSSARNPLFLRDEELDSSLELVMGAQLRLAASIRSMLDASQLKFDDFVLFFLLWRQPGMSMSDLHRSSGMTKQSLSRHVAAMVERDLIEVVVDKGDRRKRLVRLTAGAHALLAPLVATQRRLLKKAFAAAGADAVEGFREVAAGIRSATLPRVRSSLESER